VVEERNPFGPAVIVVTSEMCDEGYEFRIEDENENVIDSDKVPFDFYRDSYRKGKLKRLTEKVLKSYFEEYHDFSFDGFDFDREWQGIKAAWQDTFREAEGNLRAYGDVEGPQGKKESDFEKWEREEIEEKAENLLTSTRLIIEIDDVIHEHLSGEHRNAMVNFLACLSSLTDEPLNLRWSGRSSVGKSAIATAVANIFPEDMMLIYVGMTEKSIYYDPLAEDISENEREISLDGKVLLILEEENARDFLKEIRPLLSHDMEEHPYGFTDTSGSEPVRKTINLKGWPAYVGLSVNPEQSVELGTRELTSTPKMGSDKYGRVVDWKAMKAFAPWVKPDEERLAMVQEALSQLEEKEVWIPFIPLVRKHFPTEKARTQRDWDKLESAIKAITLLYQWQRDTVEVNGEEFLIAEPFDGLAAIDIIESAIAQAMRGMTDDQIRFHKFVARESEAQDRNRWTYRELQDLYEDWCGESIHRSTIQSRYVDPYVEANVMGRDESEKSHKMSVSSPIGPSHLSELRKVRGELLDLEYSEEYLENQLLHANRLWGENPGPDFDFNVEGTTHGPSEEDVISTMRYRFFEKEEEQGVPWESERCEGSKKEKEGGEEKYSRKRLWRN